MIEHNGIEVSGGTAVAAIEGDVLPGHEARDLLTSRGELSEATLRRALDATGNSVVIVDADSHDSPIVWVNKAFERITGYDASEAHGRNCRFLQGDATDPKTVAKLAQAVAAGMECRTTILNYRKDGTPFWNEVYISPIRVGGRVVQYVGIQQDVSERRRSEEHILHLALHDPLTGLANRRLLDERLANALEAASVRCESVALLYVDLDNFKAINDRLGHLAGDEVLRSIAQRLDTASAGRGTLLRIGGDEFLLLMPGLSEGPEEAARACAADIAAQMQAPLQVGRDVVQVTASIGVSLFPRDAADVEALLGHADSAMYEAKQAGRSRVSFYCADGVKPAPSLRISRNQPANQSAAERGETLAAILDADAVTCVFQPIVDLASGGVLGYEALARGPIGSPLERPDRLFEAARENDRVAELDWVCRATALRTAAAAGLAAPTTLFINVEPAALTGQCSPAIVDLWRKAAGGHNVILEITERALTDRPADLLRAVREARELGWGVALDDIGADTRSLALMPLLSPDVLKLDLRLVQRQPNEEIAAIVNAVAAHRERTGAHILAEGIETEEHLATASAMGATLGQGWMFGRPGPLPPQLPWAPTALARVAEPTPRPGETPFEVVREVLPVKPATKALLLSSSLYLEHQARQLRRDVVVLSAFQTAERFTPRTRRRYEQLASEAALVGALGVGLEAEPAPGVRGAEILPGDPLGGEWSVVVLGHHFSAALVAKDLGDGGPEPQRRFEFALTYDRDLVSCAAAALMRRLLPTSSGV